VLVPLASATVHGSSKVKPVDLDANDLASMVDTVYDASGSLSNSLPEMLIPRTLLKTPLRRIMRRTTLTLLLQLLWMTWS